MTKVPMQAAVILAPRCAYCRRTAEASRTSDRASAASSGPGIFHADRRNHDAVGRPRAPRLTRSLFVRLEAKPGREKELAAFLMQGLELANREEKTPVWFATQFGPTTFAIFDAFRDDAGRQNHLNGPIARALMEQAPNLLAAPPAIEPMDVLGAKLPR